jgi:hypothetical protein
MNDLDTSTDPPRLPQIDLDDSDDVHRWCEVFNCNATDLREAVIEVGPLAANVQEFLSHRPPQTLEDTKVVAIADVANDGRIEDLG